MSDERERASKGKRRYTHSPASLAQRRAAPWKHGGRAATALTQAVPPCKKSTCCMTDENEKGNCPVKLAAEAKGQALSACPVALVVNAEVREKFIRAIRDRNIDGLAELSGTGLAGLHGVFERGLEEVTRDGLAVPVSIFGPDGTEGQTIKANPAVEPLLKLGEMLGFTAAQQAITPKSQGEVKRDEGVAGMLAEFKRRSALAASSGNSQG